MGKPGRETGRVQEDQERRRRVERPRRERFSGSVGPDPEGGGTTPDREPLPTHVRDLPRLPVEFDNVLAQGTLSLGIDLQPAAASALRDHARLLLAWTRAINLTAIREPSAVAREHVLDSLAAVPLLRERGVERVVDLGSGGGYPGLPIVVALPATEALLIESIGKKARFLETAVSALGLGGRVRVTPARAETLGRDPGMRERWQAVLVRAVGSLARVAELAFPMLALDGLLVAWKRAPVDAEIEAANGIIHDLGGGAARRIPCVVPGLEDHVLVVVTKVRMTPAGYPRVPASRSARNRSGWNPGGPDRARSRMRAPWRPRQSAG